MNGINDINIALEIIPPQGPSEALSRVAYLSRDIYAWAAQEQTINGLIPIRLRLDEARLPFYVLINNIKGPNPFQNNTLIIDSVPTFNAFPQTLPPGRVMFLMPEKPVIYVKSSYTHIQVMVVQTRPNPPPTLMSLVADLGFSSAISSVIPIPKSLSSSASFIGDLAPLYIPIPSIYFQFDVNFGSVDGNTDMVDIWFTSGASGTWIDGVWPDFYYNLLYSNYGTFNPGVTLARDTWYTIGIIWRWGPTRSIELFFNGTSLGTAYVPNYGHIGSFNFGARFGYVDTYRHLDNLTVGTTGLGSSDIFSADFTTSIVPPFGSSVGSVSVDGGAMLAQGAPGFNAYAIEDISFP